MKFSRELRFALGIIFCAVVLHLFSYDEEKVAIMRLDKFLQTERGIADQVQARCSSLAMVQDRLLDRTIADRLMPSKARVDDRKCQAGVEAARTHRFFLRSQWVFMIRVQGEATNVLERSFHIEFPRPLCLLPLIAFVLAMIFGFHSVRFFWLFAVYIFLIGGGNLIRTLELCFDSALVTARSDQTFIGLSLILLWLAIQKSTSAIKPAPRESTSKLESFANRSASTMIGLWSPAFFTVLGKLQYPFRSELMRLQPFLKTQVFVGCLSLYLLSFEVMKIRSFISNNLLLPRYVSFAILLFFLAPQWAAKPRKQVILWHLPHFWRAVFFVVAVEGLSFFVPFLSELNTLTRVGLALVMSELVPNQISPLVLAKNFLPWFGMLFLASFVPLINAQSGLTDVALVLWDPKAHPNSLVLFTFFASVAIGFLTGSFSATFFALLTMLPRSAELPLVRAAALDGILAGSLLSPFSIYNLLPSVQFKIPLRDLIASRFKDLAFPLLIGTVIYGVSALESLAILRPLTFVFLILVSFAIRLQKNNWILERTGLFARYASPPPPPSAPTPQPTGA